MTNPAMHPTTCAHERYASSRWSSRTFGIPCTPRAGGTAVALPHHAERDLLGVDRQVQAQWLLGAESPELPHDAVVQAGGG